MIHTVTDFYNKAAADIKQTYFPNVKYYRDDKNCEAAMHQLELFNNGCLTYRKLIGRLAKACGHTTAKINAIIEKYIISFGSYKYKPSK